MNWKEELKDSYTPWWEKEKVKNHYTECRLHPNFAGASLTIDMDIVWFEVIKDSKEHTFSVAYYSDKDRTYINYECTEEDFVLSIGMAGINENWEENYPYGRCSIYYSAKEKIADKSVRPTTTFQFHHREGFNTHLILPSLQETSFFGLYISDWY